MNPRPPQVYSYCDNGVEIYRQSFAMIRAEADLAGVHESARTVAVRMIHASGDVALAEAMEFHPRLVEAARGALQTGATVLTDANMIAAGVTRARLPRDNEVLCYVRDPRVPALAKQWRTTRSAAAVSLWRDHLEGSVVAIGNAPTALFQLLELIHARGPRPAAIVGVPVGFVGSAESKQALAENPFDIPYLVVHGRRGGSALAASAINALAQEKEV